MTAARAFARGDRVRTSHSRMVAKVLEVRGDRLLLDTPDGPREYSAGALRLVDPRRGPAAVIQLRPEQLEAARRIACGATRDAVAAAMGISRLLLQDWLDSVREANQDARNRAAAE